MKQANSHDKQAYRFIKTLCENGWMSLNTWADGGHAFELLQKRATAKRVIVQIYPQGDGFEVWRPVCESSSIAETAVAVEQYGVSK